MLELSYKNMGANWLLLEMCGLNFLREAKTTGTGRAVLVFNDGGIRNQGSVDTKKRLIEILSPMLPTLPLKRLELCYHQCKLNKAKIY